MKTALGNILSPETGSDVRVRGGERCYVALCAIRFIFCLAYIPRMGFIREKTIKGRRYRYYQESVRIGKKVRSKMTYLGAVGTMAAITILAARDAAGKEKPRHYKTGNGQTDQRTNKHQVDYERELFERDREKWRAHMRDKMFKRGEKRETPKLSREQVRAETARAEEMREFNERLKESRAEQEASIAERNAGEKLK